MDVKDAMTACGPSSALAEFDASPLTPESCEVEVKCLECGWKVTSCEPARHRAGHRSMTQHTRFKQGP